MHSRAHSQRDISKTETAEIQVTLQNLEIMVQHVIIMSWNTNLFVHAPHAFHGASNFSCCGKVMLLAEHEKIGQFILLI